MTQPTRSDPEEPAIAGLLADTETLSWRSLELSPCNYSWYKSLSSIRFWRDPDDPMGCALKALGLWKLSLMQEVPDDVAEFLGEDHPDLNLKDPAVYREIASRYEKARVKPSPEVDDRLLPYRILNDLQIQAPRAVSPELVRKISDNGSRCVPVFRAAVPEWLVNRGRISLEAIVLVIAWLGELAGVEVLDDLLDLSEFRQSELFLHTQWAIWRLGQRFPVEVLAKYREMTPHNSESVRCIFAEQINLLPEVNGMDRVLAGLLDDFSTFADEADAPYLLMVVVDALAELSYHNEAKLLLNRHRRTLSGKGKRILQDLIDTEGGFVPHLVQAEIDGMTIEDVCLDRVFMTSEYQSEDEFDEDQAEDEQPPVVKPDRNDPCWCGSGKKYKKCHLAADEEAARSRHSGTEPQIASDRLYQSLLHELFESIRQVRSRAEIREAHRLYFDQEPEEFDARDRGAAAFFDWMIYDFRPGGTGRTVVEEYIRRRPRLPARELALLESWRNCRLGVFEVQRIDRGIGVELKDVFSGEKFFVHDVTTSREAVHWDCLLGRVQNYEAKWIFTNNGMIVPRAMLPALIERVEEASQTSGLSPADYVRANSHRMHRIFEDLYAEQDARFRVVNAEGDDLVLSAASYRVQDEDAVAATLTRAEVFEDTPVEDAAPGVRTFGWLEAGVVEGPRRSYGHIELGGGKLRLECNSRKRLAIGRQLLEKNAGAFLTHERDTFESAREIKDRVNREGPSKPPAEPSKLPPGVESKLILRLKAEHYEKWPDLPLPALNGKTPREAMKSEVGRRQLEEVLRGMENAEARDGKQDAAAFDFSSLRKTLGLD